MPDLESLVVNWVALTRAHDFSALRECYTPDATYDRANRTLNWS